MRSLLLPLALLPLFTASALSQQVVLDFDDLSGFAPMPAGYGGISNWGSWAYSDNVDPNYPAYSGATKVLSVGLQQSLVFGQDLIFDGARVVTALDFSFELFYQGSLVHTTVTVLPNVGGPAVWLPSGYAGLVDEMRYVSSVNVHGVDDFTYTIPVSGIGTNYCMANANSTGSAGEIMAVGSAVAMDNDVELIASSLPLNQFAFFITSLTQGLITNPSGSDGNLCIVGSIGRYNPNSGYSVLNSGTTGSVSLILDLTSTPQPLGAVSVMMGETWNFQAWHRDLNPGPTNNFTNGLSILFQ